MLMKFSLFNSKIYYRYSLNGNNIYKSNYLKINKNIRYILRM